MAERYPHVADDELTDDDIRKSSAQIMPLVEYIRVRVANATQGDER
jgi:hypothetical protein